MLGVSMVRYTYLLPNATTTMDEKEDLDVTGTAEYLDDVNMVCVGSRDGYYDPSAALGHTGRELRRGRLLQTAKGCIKCVAISDF